MDAVESRMNRIIASILIHSHESWGGNFKLANRHFKMFTKLICELLNEGNDEILNRLLDHEEPAVRHVGAYYLLPTNTQVAEKKIKKLFNENKDGVGTNSKILFGQWRKGELKFPRIVNGVVKYLGKNEL